MRPILDQPTSIRRAILHAGYFPLPANGKAVYLDDWSNIRATDEDISKWETTQGQARNTGVLTFKTPFADIDIYDAAVADEIESVVRKYAAGGVVLVRYGRAPKRAIAFRTDKPFDKTRTPVFIDPQGRENFVEILCDGQQLIVAGIHPETKAPYTWAPSPLWAVQWGDLPYLDETTARAMREELTAILRRTGWKEKGADRQRPSISERAVNGIAAPDIIAEIGKREIVYGAAAIENATAELAGAVRGERNDLLNKKAFSLGRQAGARRLTRDDARHRLLEACNQNGLISDDGIRAAEKTFDSGFEDGMKKPAEPLRDRDDDDAGSASEEQKQDEEQKKDEPPSPLPFIDMSNWDNEPLPDREWAVPDRIPLRQTALLSGEGGAGKSNTTLHLCCAHPLARDWLGSMPEPGPAIFLDAEDDEKELHRRVAAVANHYGVTFNDLIKGGLHLLSFAGKDVVFATVNRSGKVERTPLYKQILEAAGDIKPKMFGIASSSNVFAGNENDRTHVQQFVGLLTRVAIVANGAVQLISHPSLTGISTDTGLSGTTQWHNAVRARSYMKSIKPEAGEQSDSDLRELVFKKNQYGPISETIVLRYQRGMFLPVPGMTNLDKVAREAKAEEVFLVLLARYTRENRIVSDKPSSNYAPSLFAKEEETKKALLGSKNLAAAMRDLFKSGKIWNEPYDRPSRPRYRIMIKERTT